jgi:hypothetical protein
MLTHALRIGILTAILAHLTGALATGAAADPARLNPSPAASWTSSLPSVSPASPNLPRPTSYRPDGPDTGPPTPGPTDPNGPSS